ncbi:aryl hydrocarbon receptor-like [Astyanax mexicanus]|uniref:Aryl hydrocarbon receptor n=1 Tax=Astyanax mexicanus TaxID=7994 RepID=A0A8T2KN44_ASTMX|nr:aryl hydrocarbon receptor-like [Astyanax mexicanus]
MLGTGGTYAGKKRKKPVQKIPKPPPPEGSKSNPSKRHRDRLNMELDKLTSLLPFPEDVRSRLDKLSVLRLSVGYLKVKSYFNATMKKNVGGAWPVDRSAGSFGGNGLTVSSLDGVSFSEGDLLLQALNGFVMCVTAEGYVFYSSPTIQDYLGFHQSDVVHQSVFELIHTDDRAMFRRQLHFALNPSQGDPESEALQKSSEITTNLINYNPQQLPPENTSFLERSFCCRFRCLLDNSSGFLALNFQGRLKYLHGQNKVMEDGTIAHPQLALFIIATPLQTPSILEIRSKTLLFQTKHKLDFTPMGIDTRGKVVLGYTEIELCMRGTGYQFIHAADMMHCADNHLRMIKTGESGLTVFRLLSKAGTWIWVQSNARLVFKGGRPDFIVARQRALTNEEGEEHLRQRTLQIPFSVTTGEGVLYEVDPSLDMEDQDPSAKAWKPQPNTLMSSMVKQDQSQSYQPSDPNSQLYLERAFRDSHALLTVPGNTCQAADGSPAIKEESMVRDMMDSLQQIIGVSNLCGNVDELELNQQELKDWETVLLKMNNINTEVEAPSELTDIMANEIFTYVEDMLFNESGTVTSERLPDCLSELRLQQEFVGQGDQGFDGFLDIRGGAETGSPGRGMMKLTHIDSEMPVVPQQDVFVDSLGLSEVSGQKMPSCSKSMRFNSSLTGQQNQARLAPQNDRAERSQSSIQPGNLVYPDSVTLPNLGQNQAQPIGFHNQLNQPIRQSNHWFPNNETNKQSISLSQDIPLNPAPGACLQGQFSINTHKITNQTNQRLPTWQPHQHSVQPELAMLPNITNIPNIISVPNVPNLPKFPNGQQQAFGGQQEDVQQDPLAQLMMQSGFDPNSLPQPLANNAIYGQAEVELLQSPPNALYSQQGELMPMAANTVYNQQGQLMQKAANIVYSQQRELLGNSNPALTSSCMFQRAPQAPTNSLGYAPVVQEAMISSCQKTKGFLNQTSPQGSCFYQNSMPVPVKANTVNCHLPLGPESMQPQRQQFLACNGQTQIPNQPVKENGTFQLGTSCLFNNNQTNNF